MDVVSGKMREKSPALIGGVSVKVWYIKTRKDNRSQLRIQAPPIMYSFVKIVADMDMSNSIRGSMLKK